MERILRSCKGFRVKAGCMEMLDGARVTVCAERPFFRRGMYSVAIDDLTGRGDISMEGPLPQVAGRLSRMERAGAIVGILSRVASAVSDPAPLFEPQRRWREEELTRHLTDKEIAILACLMSGVCEPARIREVFGLGRLGLLLGRIELGASSLVFTSWDSGMKEYALTDSGRKMMEKAREEPPMRAALEWVKGINNTSDIASHDAQGRPRPGD